MSDTDKLVIRGRMVNPAVGGTVARVVPGSEAWAYSGLEVLVLAAGSSRSLTLDGVEGLVLPLSGGCRVDVLAPRGGEEHLVLAGRPDVFSGPSDSVYAPVGSRLTIHAPALGPVRVAVATARAGSTCPVRLLRADEATVIALQEAHPASKPGEAPDAPQPQLTGDELVSTAITHWVLGKLDQHLTTEGYDMSSRKGADTYLMMDATASRCE